MILFILEMGSEILVYVCRILGL